MNCKTCGHKIIIKRLRVGDRVEANGGDLNGEKGTVKHVDTDNTPVLVELDNAMGGHDGGGYCKDGHGRWGEHEDFKVIKTKRRGK